MLETYMLYVFGFLLGFIGSAGYFLSLVLYGRIGRFKTKAGQIKIYKIFGFCIIGGIIAALFQATIKEGFAPVHAIVLGSGWMIIFGPLRNTFYQLQEERKNYKKLLEQNLISLTSREIKSTKAKDFIEKDIEKVSPTATLFSFLPALRDGRSRLVIVEESQSPCKAIGVIGHGDVVRFLLTDKLNKGLKSIHAREVMNKNFVYAQSDDTFGQVINKMDKANIVNIVVLDKDKEPLGWLNEKAFRIGIINKMYSK